MRIFKIKGAPHSWTQRGFCGLPEWVPQLGWSSNGLGHWRFCRLLRGWNMGRRHEWTAFSCSPDVFLSDSVHDVPFRWIHCWLHAHSTGSVWSYASQWTSHVPKSSSRFVYAFTMAFLCFRTGTGTRQAWPCRAYRASRWLQMWGDFA